MFRTALIATVLAASFSAQAEIITQEVSFGTQGSYIDTPLGALNESLFIDRFDSTLGTLESVTVHVEAQIDSAGSSQNISEANGRADVGIVLLTDWLVSNEDTGFSYTLLEGSSTTPILSAESSPENVFTLIPETDEDTFTYSLSTGLLSQTINVLDMAFFSTDEGTEQLDFVFSTFANTNINNDVESGTGRFVNSFNSGTYGKLVVEYNYSESDQNASASEVHEPAMAGLMALPLAFMALRRRNKKRS